MNRNTAGSFSNNKGTNFSRPDNNLTNRRGKLVLTSDNNNFGFVQKGSSSSNGLNGFNSGNGRVHNLNNMNSTNKKFETEEINEARESLKLLSNKFGNNFRGTNDFSVKTTTSTISSNFSNNSNSNSTYRQSFKPSFTDNNDEDDLAMKLGSNKGTYNDFSMNNRKTNKPVGSMNQASKKKVPVREVEDDRPAFSQTHNGFG